MKIELFLIAVFLFIINDAWSDEPGFQEGYEKGQVIEQELNRPLTVPPMPKMPPMPKSPQEDTYEGGLVRGYEDAKEAADE